MGKKNREEDREEDADAIALKTSLGQVEGPTVLAIPCDGGDAGDPWDAKGLQRRSDPL